MDHQPEPKESKRRLLIDATGLTGLALIAVGVWILSPAWSLIIVGSLLLAGGIVGAMRQNANDSV